MRPTKESFQSNGPLWKLEMVSITMIFLLRLVTWASLAHVINNGNLGMNHLAPITQNLEGGNSCLRRLLEWKSLAMD